MTVYNPYFKPFDVYLKNTNPKHITQNNTQNNADNVVPSFAELLNKALGNTNNLQLESEKLQVAMTTNPESVDPHTVALAQTKAELALSFTKAIISRMVTAYKELENLR